MSFSQWPRLPVIARAPDGSSLGGAGDPPFNEEMAAQYFSGLHTKKWIAWLKNRQIMTLLRLAAVVFGLAVIAATFYYTYATLETKLGDLNAFYAALRQRLLPLFTGALIALIGAIPFLWRSWQLPVGTFALGMALELFFLDLGDRALAAVLLVAALGAFVYFTVITRREKPPAPDEEIEKVLDRWVDTIVPEVVRKAGLPVSDSLANSRLVLKSFPKRERTGTIEPVCRIGSDNRPRVTPLGIALFELRPDTLVAFEGAIDLPKKSLVYARVHEFRYEDIVALLWNRDASMSSARAAAGPAMAGAGARATRHRDVLEIRLVSGRSVSLVFGDSDMLPLPERPKEKRKVEMIESVRNISTLWDDILERQGKARGRDSA